jgi:hypothetical protein
MSESTWRKIPPHEFVNLLKAKGLFFPDYLDHDAIADLEEEDEEELEADFLIWDGDLHSDEPVFVFPDAHVLVTGNLTTKVLHLNREMVTVQVAGDVTCDHLNCGFEQMVVIGGSLDVKGIVNRDYEDAELIVVGDFSAEYLGGHGVNCGGKATFTYGDGVAVGLDYWDLPVEKRTNVRAAQDIAASSAYIGFDLANMEVPQRDLLREKILP